MCNSAQSWNNIRPNPHVLIQTKYNFLFCSCHLKPYAQTVRLQFRVWTESTLGYSRSSCNHASSPKCVAGSFKMCITWHASIILLIIWRNAAFQLQRMKQTNVFRVWWHFKKSRKIISRKRKNEGDTEKKTQKMVKCYDLYLSKYCTGFLTFCAYNMAN
jgi:hypothetical protein